MPCHALPRREDDAPRTKQMNAAASARSPVAAPTTELDPRIPYFCAVICARREKLLKGYLETEVSEPDGVAQAALVQSRPTHKHLSSKGGSGPSTRTYFLEKRSPGCFACGRQAPKMRLKALASSYLVQSALSQPQRGMSIPWRQPKLPSLLLLLLLRSSATVVPAFLLVVFLFLALLRFAWLLLVLLSSSASLAAWVCV